MRDAIARLAREHAATRRELGLRWWVELLLVGIFYGVYSFCRNLFGSAAVDWTVAYENALEVIDVEEALGLYIEEDVQDLFVDWTPFIQFWNVFYGSFHFGVTAFALLFLWFKFPRDYPLLRTTGLATTGLALIGFSLYPLMPPRLLGDCGEYGACIADTGYVDTMREIGGLWSFDSGTAQKLSNQYAAMPSLHIGWAVWSTIALYPRVKSGVAKTLVALYPWATLFTIVVTANHYWIDAIGGLGGLALGYLIALAIHSRWPGSAPPADPDAAIGASLLTEGAQ